MTFFLLVSTALACPVCGGGGQNQQAFVDTMVFMSLTPLLMIGAVAGGLFWLARRAAQLDSEAESEALEERALRQP